MQVICRMLVLHMRADLATNYQTDQYFGPGSPSQPILLTGLQCNGAEATIFDCSHDSSPDSGCTHLMDAGVVCQYNWAGAPNAPPAPP